jgi:hypothetical protein
MSAFWYHFDKERAVCCQHFVYHFECFSFNCCHLCVCACARALSEWVREGHREGRLGILSCECVFTVSAKNGLTVH